MSNKWLQYWEPPFSKSSFILSRYGCHVFFIHSIDVPLSCISFTNSWHQTLAGSCFQYLCISPPTAGSNLQNTVHELRYSLACSNVVVGQAARRTFAGASFQTKLRLTLILNIRCCRHCSPYSRKSIAGKFGIANWSGPNTPTAVGNICAKRVRMGCEPNNFTSTLGLMRYVSMSMQFDP